MNYSCIDEYFLFLKNFSRMDEYFLYLHKLFVYGRKIKQNSKIQLLGQ
jgi:hypothetical protein